jgi:hypothetical protein
MKDVNKIKIKINLYKYRYLIYLIFLVIVLLVFIKILPYINIPTDATTIGVVGTLLGAIVGGIFTLIGSIYVNNKQLTANFEIKRKNIIYKPLYDELLDVNKIILEENPYPTYIIFAKRTQTIVRHPQFDAWNRIKSDSRILETPKCLKEQYNKLINSIKEYEKIRSSVNEPIKNALNEELKNRFCTSCSISNIGDVISSEILENRTDKHFLKSYITNPMNHEKNLSDLQIAEVEQALYDKCSELQEIKDVKDAYNIWLREQNNTIELLENLIIEIGIKYEKQRS